jgi:group I intron endonuclease
MKIQEKYNNKCGIYAIKNLKNNKLYIGKSVNINQRILAHKNNLNRKNLKEENSHFINSWHKYKEDSFIYFILEECEYKELTEKELYWILKLNSNNPKKGYNKRLDTLGGMIPHEETRQKLSIAGKNRFKDQKERDKVSVRFKEFWENNPDKKQKMALNVKKTKQLKYKFYKMDEQENILQEYNSIEDILKENPTYKWQNIYSVCNGYKKRIYGFKWKKVEDIVRHFK